MTRRGKSSSREWVLQRGLALAMIPLMLLFIFPFASTFGGTQSEVLVTYANPFHAFVTLALSVILFAHLHQGLDEVITDYAHSKLWLTILHTANSTFCWVMGLLAIVAIARIALFP